jgi:NADH-quinone oxidoreductase subunit M
MGQILLLTMLFLPLAVGAVIFFLGSDNPRLIKNLALVASTVTFVLAAIICITYQPTGSPGREVPRAEVDPVAAHQMFHPDPQFTVNRSWLTFETSDANKPIDINFHVGVDGLSLWLIALTALLMIPSVLISWDSIQEQPAGFYALLLVLETGMLGVFCAFDIILFYVFFEFTLIPLFFIIGIWGGPQKRYAARKFFIYTLAGSLLGLVALVALILYRSGIDGGMTFSLLELIGNTNTKGSVTYEIQKWLWLGLFCGFAIKVPLFPFHTWLPLAHTEAPTAGSVLLAGVLLKLGTYGFLRLSLPLLPEASVELGIPMISWLAIIGIIYGALCALAQDDIKKLVAYSSVSHLGFCMLGMFALNAEGLAGAVLQMVNHGLTTGMLFLIVGMVYDRYHTRSLREMSGLGSKLKLITVFMVFACLAGAGLPGLNGFVGEFLCLAGMWKVRPLYTALASIGILLGAWYLLTMLQKAFFGPLKEPGHAPAPELDDHGHAHGHGEEGHAHTDHGSSTPDLTGREALILAPLAFVCVWIGVYPQPFIDRLKPEVTALGQKFERMIVIPKSNKVQATTTAPAAAAPTQPADSRGADFSPPPEKPGPLTKGSTATPSKPQDNTKTPGKPTSPAKPEKGGR